MDLRKIKKLIELVEESGITEIEVKSGDEAVRIVRPGVNQLVSTVNSPVAPEAVQMADTRQTGSSPTDPACIVMAPLTGTFYRAPNPGDEPYVSAGQQVKVGDVLCIIESMKMMNHIEAEQAGVITAVLAEDGAPVQEEQSLFTIE